VSRFFRCRFLPTRGGQEGLPSTSRSFCQTWTPSPPPQGVPHRGTMGTHADTTVPSCPRRLHLSLGSCGVTSTLPRYSNDFSRLLFARAEPQTRERLAIDAPQSSSRITSSKICPLGTSANARICAAMGLIPSRGSTHDHIVDRRCPSKHQNTSVDLCLSAPLRPSFCHCQPTRGTNSLSASGPPRPFSSECTLAMKWPSTAGPLHSIAGLRSVSWEPSAPLRCASIRGSL
jgi:hypothetical protein